MEALDGRVFFRAGYALDLIVCRKLVRLRLAVLPFL
jgi:hypothetical protein